MSVCCWLPAAHSIIGFMPSQNIMQTSLAPPLTINYTNKAGNRKKLSSKMGFDFMAEKFKYLGLSMIS